MTPWVLGVMQASRASKLIWNRAISGGTTTSLPPLASVKGRYSGKKGATAMISLSGPRISALSTDTRAGAAPQVKNRFSGRALASKRRLRSSATALRTPS